MRESKEIEKRYFRESGNFGVDERERERERERQN